MKLFARDSSMDAVWHRDEVPADRWIGIILDEAGWTKLPGELGHGGATSGDRPDFKSSVAVVGYMGMMRSGGHQIALREVTYTHKGAGSKDRVEITIDVKSPGPGEMVTQALTNPYDVVRIARDAWPQGALSAIAGGEVVLDVLDQDGRSWGPGHVLQ